MTSAEWVEQTLATKIVAVDGVNHVNLGDQVVAVVDFVTIFGGSLDAELAKLAEQRDFYTALSGVQTFTWEGEQITATATELGYQVFFDAWHAEGLI